MTRFTRKSLLAVAVLSAFGAGAAFAADASLKTEKDKVSYMVGMQIGRSLGQIKDDIDLATVYKAMQDSVGGGKTLLTDEEANKVGQEFQQKLQTKHLAEQKAAAEKNKSEGEAFLAANKSKPGVKTTASGLQYQVVKEGSAKKPKATDTVKVDYTGTKIDGTKFDSSIDRGTPATFPLNGVIKGWTEGLQLMGEGAEYKLFIPADLAYGENAPPNIGPNATLIFDVKLISIENAAAAEPAKK
ncbi:MAG: FKBP-type peptidyl-prolyl cis-trans isomerase [Dokdonella sp.]|jgi:FKBP-type peptidyl-prolyl cis-trans isomerase FkpA|uniref:FKBP-type peptidyl-prolyl cis-trans isomerase n=1 Tax=Dokdonella sp. TaxID=2291710 RepID=UPI0029D4B526|nr:FKBP-type peptidyl-prolyl cis-trans isomerase [Dokdonella sp.]MCR6699743.1 FKBP-type peptidyl-prolyl cis-trans isomerase [Dokdonella sp.]HUD42382.1 FKBP-type peptidyl-prolyl cis-trans isomerase [Dokdonella sp.]